MKKLIAILLVTMITYSLIAQEENTDQQAIQPEVAPEYRQTLIDFTQVHANAENLTLEYGKELRLTLSEEEFANLQPIDFSLENWLVMPASSIRYREVLDKSFARPVEVAQGIQRTSEIFATPAQGDFVLGVRLKFPNHNFDMRFEILSPFPANFNDEAFVNNGILTNVGLVKSAYITVYGLYQKEKIYLITEDTGGNTYEYGFGSLDYVGWRELEWVNPSYVEDTAEREIDARPIYPKEDTARRFKAVKIMRAAQLNTENFVTYISNIKLTFDKAINDDLFNEFANEDIWSIMKDTASARETVLIKRTTTERFFQFLEQRKKYDYNSGATENATGQ